MDILSKTLECLESPTRKQRNNGTVTMSTKAGKHVEYALKDATAERLMR